MASNDSMFGFGMSAFPPAFDTEPPPMNVADESEFTSDVAFSNSNNLDDWGDFSNFTSVESVENNSCWASFSSPPLTPHEHTDNANSTAESSKNDLNEASENKTIDDAEFTTTGNKFDIITLQNEMNCSNNHNLPNGSYIVNTNDTDFVLNNEQIKGFDNIMFETHDQVVHEFPPNNEIINNSEIDMSGKKDSEFTNFQELNVANKSDDDSLHQTVVNEALILIDHDNIETVAKEVGDQLCIEDGEYIQNLNNNEESPPLLSDKGNIQESLNPGDEVQKEYRDEDGDYFIQESITTESSISNCKMSDDDFSKPIDDNGSIDISSKLNGLSQPIGPNSETKYSEERNGDLDNNLDINIDVKESAVFRRNLFECKHDNICETSNLKELLGQSNGEGDISIYEVSNTAFNIDFGKVDSDQFPENTLAELAKRTDSTSNNFNKLVKVETYSGDLNLFNSKQENSSSHFGIKRNDMNSFNKSIGFNSVQKESSNVTVNFEVVNSSQIVSQSNDEFSDFTDFIADTSNCKLDLANFREEINLPNPKNSDKNLHAFNNLDSEPIVELPQQKTSLSSENLYSECNSIVVQGEPIKTQILVEGNCRNTNDSNIPDFIGQGKVCVMPEDDNGKETVTSSCDFGDFDDADFESCGSETTSSVDNSIGNFGNFDTFQFNQTEMREDFFEDTDNAIHKKLQSSIEHNKFTSAHIESCGFQDFGSFDSAPGSTTAHTIPVYSTAEERFPPTKINQWASFNSSSTKKDNIELQTAIHVMEGGEETKCMDIVNSCFPYLDTGKYGKSRSGNKRVYDLICHLTSNVKPVVDLSLWEELNMCDEDDSKYSIHYFGSNSFQIQIISFQLDYRPIKLDMEMGSTILIPVPAASVPSKNTLLAQSLVKSVHVDKDPFSVTLKKDSASETTSETTSLDLEFFINNNPVTMPNPHQGTTGAANLLDIDFWDAATCDSQQGAESIKPADTISSHLAGTVSISNYDISTVQSNEIPMQNITLNEEVCQMNESGSADGDVTLQEDMTLTNALESSENVAIGQTVDEFSGVPSDINNISRIKPIDEFASFASNTHSFLDTISKDDFASFKSNAENISTVIAKDDFGSFTSSIDGISTDNDDNFSSISFNTDNVSNGTAGDKFANFNYNSKSVMSVEPKDGFSNFISSTDNNSTDTQVELSFPSDVSSISTLNTHDGISSKHTDGFSCLVPDIDNMLTTETESDFASFESSSINIVSTVNNSYELSSIPTTADNISHDFSNFSAEDNITTVNTVKAFSSVFIDADLNAIPENDFDSFSSTTESISIIKTGNDFPCFTSNTESITAIKHDNQFECFATQDDFAMFTSAIPDDDVSNFSGNAESVSDINVNTTNPKIDFSNVISNIEAVSATKGNYFTNTCSDVVCVSTTTTTDDFTNPSSNTGSTPAIIKSVEDFASFTSNIDHVAAVNPNEDLARFSSDVNVTSTVKPDISYSQGRGSDHFTDIALKKNHMMNTGHNVIDHAHPISNADQIGIKINTKYMETNYGCYDSVSVSMESPITLNSKLKDLSIGESSQITLSNSIVNFESSAELFTSNSECVFSLENWTSNVTTSSAKENQFSYNDSIFPVTNAELAVSNPAQKFDDFLPFTLGTTTGKKEGCMVSDFQNVLMPSAVFPSIIGNSSEGFPDVSATRSKSESNDFPMYKGNSEQFNDNGQQVTSMPSNSEKNLKLFADIESANMPTKSSAVMDAKFSRHFCEESTCDGKIDNSMEFSSLSNADSTSVVENTQPQNTLGNFEKFSVCTIAPHETLNGQFSLNDVNICSRSSDPSLFPQTIPDIFRTPKLPKEIDSFGQLSDTINNQPASETSGNFAKFEMPTNPLSNDSFFTSTEAWSGITSSYQIPESTQAVFNLTNLSEDMSSNVELNRLGEMKAWRSASTNVKLEEKWSDDIAPDILTLGTGWDEIKTIQNPQTSAIDILPGNNLHASYSSTQINDSAEMKSQGSIISDIVESPKLQNFKLYSQLSGTSIEVDSCSSISDYQFRKDSEREFSDFGDFTEHQDVSTKEDFAEFESFSSTNSAFSFTNENQGSGNIKRKISFEKRVSISKIPANSDGSGIQISTFSNTSMISTNISTRVTLPDLPSYSSPESQVVSFSSTSATDYTASSVPISDDLFCGGSSNFANFADSPVSTLHNDFLNNQFNMPISFANIDTNVESNFSTSFPIPSAQTPFVSRMCKQKDKRDDYTGIREISSQLNSNETVKSESTSDYSEFADFSGFQNVTNPAIQKPVDFTTGYGFSLSTESVCTHPSQYHSSFNYPVGVTEGNISFIQHQLLDQPPLYQSKSDQPHPGTPNWNRDKQPSKFPKSVSVSSSQPHGSQQPYMHYNAVGMLYPVQQASHRFPNQSQQLRSQGFMNQAQLVRSQAFPSLCHQVRSQGFPNQAQQVKSQGISNQTQQQYLAHEGQLQNVDLQTQQQYLLPQQQKQHLQQGRMPKYQAPRGKDPFASFTIRNNAEQLSISLANRTLTSGSTKPKLNQISTKSTARNPMLQPSKLDYDKSGT